MYQPSIEVVITLVVCFLILIPLFLFLRRQWIRDRELLRKAREDREWLQTHGVELGCRVYVYDPKSDSFVRVEGTGGAAHPSTDSTKEHEGEGKDG